MSCSAYGLDITNLVPANYQVAPLEPGTNYYWDQSHTITAIPKALAGGTLIRTRSSDAINLNLIFRFNSDVRSQVYVCYDSRPTAPSWLSGWVATDMVVGVSGTPSTYKVYSKRFQSGTVELSPNQADTMYFVVVKESLPKLPRYGWVLLSYDMPYLREVIKAAPEYDVNALQISHDIIMNTWEVLEQPTRQANINELINLAHAYGVTEVTLWTHEVCTRGIPQDCLAPPGHVATGHADGNNPDMWAWIRGRYAALFQACPEADGIILTLSEVDDNVYEHYGDGNPGLPPGTNVSFKHDGYTQQQSVAMIVDNLQQVLAPLGKILYVRSWQPGFTGWDKWAMPVIRDGVLLNGDTSVWFSNKNCVGDWEDMDNPEPLIGTLQPDFNEMVEFDAGFEYFGKGETTACLTSYFKYHWNRALSLGVKGAIARIDRTNNFSYYRSNRVNLHGFKEVIANPDVNPLAANLAWCQQQFPPEAAADIAAYYDNPDTELDGDTRYMTWEAYYPQLSPIDRDEALDIAYTALRRVVNHRTALMSQTTLNTRQGVNDYTTLWNGIMTAVVKLGGTVPDFIPPSVPYNVQAEGISPTNISITWLPSADNVGVTGYRIYRNGELIGTSGSTNYVDARLAPLTTYSYTVSAYDAFDNHSALSSPRAVATTLSGTDLIAPSVPTDVVASAGASMISASLTWSASSDNIGVVAYKVRRNGVVVGSSVVTSFMDVGLTRDTIYTYTVAACDAAGNLSAQSLPSATTTLPEITTSDTVNITNLVPSKYEVTSFDVGTRTFVDRTYTIQTMPDKYRGYRGIQTANDDKDKTTLDFHFTISHAAEIYVVLRSSLSPIPGGALDGFRYTGDVIYTSDLNPAYNVWRKTYPAGVVSLGPKPGAGNNESMYFVLLRAADAEAPSVPTDVEAAYQSSSSICITWAASTDNVGVVGYRVYRNGVFVGAAAGTDYTDGGLTPGTTYSYTVAAFDGSGNLSAQSNSSVQATIPVQQISHAKKMPDSTPIVGMDAKVITAVFGTSLYIAEPDRSSGIKVVPTQMPTGFSVGQIVDVSGILDTEKGERFIGGAAVVIR